MSTSQTELVKLTEDQIKSHLNELNLDWELINNGTELCRTFKFKNYWTTIGFVNSLAWIAQQERHHPDLEVSYGKCVVRYTTHDADGITSKDFDCLKRIETLNLN